MKYRKHSPSTNAHSCAGRNGREEGKGKEGRENCEGDGRGIVIMGENFRDVGSVEKAHVPIGQ